MLNATSTFATPPRASEKNEDRPFHSCFIGLGLPYERNDYAILSIDGSSYYCCGTPSPGADEQLFHSGILFTGNQLLTWASGKSDRSVPIEPSAAIGAAKISRMVM